MTVFDYAVLLIVSLSICLSLWRGLAREVLALAGWVIAFVTASFAAGPVSGLLTGNIANESIRVLVAFGAVFLLTLLVASLLALAVSRLVRSAGLGLEDRILGSFFGFARGMLVVMILVLLAGLTALPRQPAWRNAMLSPPLEALAGAIKPWLPQAVSHYISYD